MATIPAHPSETNWRPALDSIVNDIDRLAGSPKNPRLAGERAPAYAARYGHLHGFISKLALEIPGVAEAIVKHADGLMWATEQIEADLAKK